MWPPSARDLARDVVTVQIAIVDEREDQEIGAPLLGGVDGGALQQTAVHI